MGGTANVTAGPLLATAGGHLYYQIDLADMSDPGRSVRDMNGRKARQARRDARQRAEQESTSSMNPLLDPVRETLAGGHPLRLLLTAAQLIEMGKPLWADKFRRGAPELIDLPRAIAGLINVRTPEVAVLLAAFAELLVDDPDLQQQCREEVALRGDPLPDWLMQLTETQVYRVVLTADVLGDRDDLVLGVRLPSGDEFVCVAAVDHLRFSAVSDVGLWTGGSVDAMLSSMAGHADPDNRFVDMSAADARVWLKHGMRDDTFIMWDSPAPGCRMVLQWLITRLPEGGREYQPPGAGPEATAALMNAFFSSPQGSRFARDRDVLDLMMASGPPDPLRWSTSRVNGALDSVDVDDMWLRDGRWDAPDLLRAFIPVAHALSGIRSELTDRALAAIDDAEPAFRERIAEALRRWDDEDDEDWHWSA